MTNKSVFQTLNEIDITSKVKQKNRMNYLPWSTAVEEVLKHYPTAKFYVVRNADGWNYFTDGKTCWVETEIEIDGIVRGEMLAIMDFKNAAIPAEKVTSVDVNKSIKRCLVKNLAMFGLGINLYYGEELSDNAKQKKKDDNKALEKVQTELFDLMLSKANDGCDKESLFEYVKKLIGSKNPRSVQDIELLSEAIEKVKEITPETLK